MKINDEKSIENSMREYFVDYRLWRCNGILYFSNRLLRCNANRCILTRKLNNTTRISNEKTFKCNIISICLFICFVVFTCFNFRKLKMKTATYKRMCNFVYINRIQKWNCTFFLKKKWIYEECAQFLFNYDSIVTLINGYVIDLWMSLFHYDKHFKKVYSFIQPL